MQHRLATAGIVLLVFLAGCGDKVPESAAAVKAGAAPKQLVDKAAGDVSNAMQQSMTRSSEVDQVSK